MAAVDKACTGNGSLDSGESFSRSFTVKTRPPQPVSGRVRFKSYLNAGGARELHTCASTVSFMGGCRVNDARFSPTRTSRYLMTTRYTYTWGQTWLEHVSLIVWNRTSLFSWHHAPWERWEREKGEIQGTETMEEDQRTCYV